MNASTRTFSCLSLPATLLAVVLAAMLTASHANAVPITPMSDDEVIEVLPAATANRTEARRQRQQLTRQPRDAGLALTMARGYLDQAHATGDPRYAGLAMAAISGWADEATMPDAVLLMRAVLLQYLHEFDAAARSLARLLARPAVEPRPQAWLTLATVRRVQGRYAESDVACRQVGAGGAALLHANACLAENAALRGDVDRARATFTGLLATARNAAPATQAWLLTSLAELEQRAGRPAAAEVAFQSSIKLEQDPYAQLSYADFLIEQRRPAQAIALLKGQVRSDAVLLRLAIAGKQAHAPTAVADAAEMRERIALANERPDARVFHGREQAMFALHVEGRVEPALELARGNVAQQREPLDLLVLAQAARAAADPAALKAVKRLTQEIGLHDQRVDALL